MTGPIPGLFKVIGAGLDSASARLEKLSHTKWTMQTMSVRQFKAEDFASTLAGESGEGFGVLFAAGGSAFVVFLSAASATAICRAFLGPAYKAATEREAIAEVSNIVVNAMIDQIGDATGELMLLNAPRVVEGQRSEILSRALENFRTGGRPSPIVSQVHMMAEGLSADFSIVLLMSSAARSRL